MRIPRQQVARPTEPGEKSHDRRGVEPGDLRAGASAFVEATFGESAAVMAEMKRQVPFDRQMDVDRTREKRNHAEPKTQQKTDEIKIRPGHTSPRTRHLSRSFPLRCASWNSRSRPPQFRNGGACGKPLPRLGPLPALLPGCSTSERRSDNPGVRRISASSKSGVRESGVSAMVMSAFCSSGSAVNCPAPAYNQESTFASKARSSDCKPGV